MYVTCVLSIGSPEEDVRSPRTGDIGSCELLGTGARNGTLVL